MGYIASIGKSAGRVGVQRQQTYSEGVGGKLISSACPKNDISGKHHSMLLMRKQVGPHYALVQSIKCVLNGFMLVGRAPDPLNNGSDSWN